MNPLFDKPFTFDRVARILFGLAVISGIIYLIAVLRNALLPFLIAWLLAYMMQPFVKFFQYKVKLKSRLLSILAVLVSRDRTYPDDSAVMGRVSGKEYRPGPVGTAPEQREHRKGGQTDRSQNVDRTD